MRWTRSALLPVLGLLAGCTGKGFQRRVAASHTPGSFWPDRRILGTVYLSSSPAGDPARPGGFPTNPRRYFNDPAVDVLSAGGVHKFQARVLAEAAAAVRNAHRMNAQGIITWDIEGEQYPQKISYVCAPDTVATTAPEMEAVVGPGLPHAGMKLDDAYFLLEREGGLRVGVCVRPQRFEQAPDGTARQEVLPADRVLAELIRKMRYAHDRWGATVFYLDSTVGKVGLPLPSAVLEGAAHALPDSLLIPENALPAAYRATAPFRSFLMHGETGIARPARLFYPHAFAATLVNDVDPARLQAHRAELVDAVRRGDLLMLHAGYWHPNNDAAMQIYRDAGRP